MKTLPLIALLAIVTPVLNGCGTMFNSGSQSIVATATNGKQVRVHVTTPSGAYTAQLPMTIVSEPSTFNPVKIQVQDECYEASQIEAHKSVAYPYWANILNIYGFLIDWLTGDMWKYDDHINMPVTEKNDPTLNCQVAQVQLPVISLPLAQSAVVSPPSVSAPISPVSNSAIQNERKSKF